MTQETIAAANLAKLPELCYALVACRAPGSRIVVIRAGESGFYQTDYDSPGLSLEQVREVVDQLNAKLGVTPQQKEAMLAGSMFGWQAPAADPDRYSIH